MPLIAAAPSTALTTSQAVAASHRDQASPGKEMPVPDASEQSRPDARLLAARRRAERAAVLSVVESPRTSFVINTQSAGLTHELAKKLSAAQQAQGGITPLMPLFSDSHAVRIEDVRISAAVEQAIREMLTGMLVDFAAVPDGRMLSGLKVAGFDFDRTLADADSAEELRKRVIFDEGTTRWADAEELEQALRQARNAMKIRPSLEFDKTLRTFLTLHGVPQATVDACVEDVLNRMIPGAKELIATLKLVHARQIVLSGGFSPFVEEFGRREGIEAVGIKLGRDAGCTPNLSGTITPPVMTGRTKALLLYEAFHKSGAHPYSLSYAGDGSNDKEALKATRNASGLGVAVCAVPKDTDENHPGYAVEKAGNAVIRVGNLMAMLYFFSDAGVAHQ
jgi:HAD superfamily phosphoserine phosphatase-like hydrolase